MTEATADQTVRHDVITAHRQRLSKFTIALRKDGMALQFPVSGGELLLKSPSRMRKVAGANTIINMAFGRTTAKVGPLRNVDFLMAGPRGRFFNPMELDRLATAVYPVQGPDIQCGIFALLTAACSRAQELGMDYERLRNYQRNFGRVHMGLRDSEMLVLEESIVHSRQRITRPAFVVAPFGKIEWAPPSKG